jgi:hypothetical protein
VTVRVLEKCPVSNGFSAVFGLSPEQSELPRALAQVVDLFSAFASDTEMCDTPEPDVVLCRLDQHEDEGAAQIAQPDDPVAGLTPKVDHLELGEIPVEVDAAERVAHRQRDVAEPSVHPSAIGIHPPEMKDFRSKIVPGTLLAGA